MSQSFRRLTSTLPLPLLKSAPFPTSSHLFHRPLQQHHHQHQLGQRHSSLRHENQSPPSTLSPWSMLCYAVAIYGSIRLLMDLYHSYDESCFTSEAHRHPQQNEKKRKEALTTLIRGNSMSPAIHNGDRVILDMEERALKGIGKGDVVALIAPDAPEKKVIKRVVGLPGDRFHLMRSPQLRENEQQEHAHEGSNLLQKQQKKKKKKEKKERKSEQNVNVKKLDKSSSGEAVVVVEPPRHDMNSSQVDIVMNGEKQHEESKEKEGTENSVDERPRENVEEAEEKEEEEEDLQAGYLAGKDIGDTVIVPPGHLWIEGDNHNSSRDSRDYGPVPMGLIFAKATHRLYQKCHGDKCREECAPMHSKQY